MLWSTQFELEWLDAGREPQCQPNPAYPNGMDIGPSERPGVCKLVLPYPAKRCGAYVARCTKCGASVGVTTAGRPDDPRSVGVICRRQDDAMRARTVAICDDCWREQEGEREPVRLREPQAEFCHFCGLRTHSGIYTRAMVKEAS